jgi:hypothetical protein
VATLTAILHGANLAGSSWGIRPFTPLWWEDEPAVEVERTIREQSTETQHDDTIRRTELRGERRRDAHAGETWVAVYETWFDHPDGRTDHLVTEVLVARNLRALMRVRAAQLITFVLPLGYFVVLERSRWQGTIGKRLLGLQVATAQGERMSWLRALFRQACKFLELVIGGLGYVIAAFNSRGQAFHDLLSRTIVHGPAASTQTR